MPHLLEPLRIGECQLKHRVVMAPMTRLRADEDHVPTDMVVDYYAQRASVPGTLLITEAVFVSAASRGRDRNAPGIYSPEQIKKWARVAEAVHARGSFIFMQLWHVGRAAQTAALAAAGLPQAVSASDIPISDEFPTPRPMTEQEIQECIADFASAAKNAVEAGFDGVEVHGANGYLIDQFLHDQCNKRTDQWGGSIENRSRFCFEVSKAVCAAIGPERTGVRLSPFSDFQGMQIDDPVPQFTDIIERLRTLSPAYLHLVEPRLPSNLLVNTDNVEEKGQNLDFAYKAWQKAGALILAGGYTKELAEQTVSTTLKDELVAIAFGRYFLSTPDLPFRVANDLPYNTYDRSTFYKVKSRDGYTDYPLSDKWKAKVEVNEYK
ncbi:hypothetical protein SEUCBS139899_003120 [Sporothrix eucalyptigena]